MSSHEAVEVEVDRDLVTSDADGDSVIADIITRLNRQQEQINDLKAELKHKESKIENLEKTVQAQESLVEALRSRNNSIIECTFGEDWLSIDEDSFRPLYERLIVLQDDLEEEKQRSEVVGSSSASTPDERAKVLRRALFENAKRISRERENFDGLKTRLDRDQAKAALGGGLHRGTVLDAMKRAADGREADDPECVDYTPINGSSSLDPSEAISYTTGENNPGKTNGQQSELVMSVDDVTGSEARKNLTTGSDEQGASK